MKTARPHRIAIGRWNVACLLAAGDTALEMPHKLDSLLRNDVAQACARSLNRTVSEADPSIWLIRSLHIDFSTLADPAAADRTARAWGEQIAGTIHRTITRGEEEDFVLHFPDRAAYLARLARDLATGSAFGKWYYEEFSALFSLSASRAIREALTAEPEFTGAAMVGLIAIQGLQRVLATLADADALAIFETWQREMDDARTADEALWVGRLLTIWSETPFRETSTGSGYHLFRDGLWWLALAVSRYPFAETDGALIGAVQSLLDLRALLSPLDYSSRDKLIQRLAAGDLGGATRLVMEHGSSSLETLQFFMRNMQSDAAWAMEAQGVLLGEQEYLRKSSAPKVMTRGPAVPSLCAGIFRLGPSLLAAGAHLAMSNLSEPHASALRHLIAVKCLGRSRAVDSVGDPAMRLFSGFAASHLAPALAEVTQVALPDFPKGRGPVWLLEGVDVPGSGTTALLLRDLMEDEWSWAEFCEPGVAGIEHAVERGLSKASQLSDSASPVLLSRALPCSAKPGMISMPADSKAVEDLARDLNIPLQLFLRATTPLTDELAWFMSGDTVPGVPSELELPCTLLARRTLKNFARRLIGFAGSTPEHLYQSFLAGCGFVRDSRERIEVELPQPPLSIVLKMAGILDETYALPWLEGRSICLLRLPE